MRQDDPGPERRRYEAAVLAELELELTSRRRVWPAVRGTLLCLAQVLFAVLLGRALAAGVGGPALLLAGMGWLTCTALLARAMFRVGRRLSRIAG